jgi:hypothetical protein
MGRGPMTTVQPRINQEEQPPAATDRRTAAAGSLLAAGQEAWMAAMRSGNFRQAWNISDAVLRQRLEHKVCCWNWPRHLQFVWTGKSLAGKRVLVRCYHGLGDTIQFIRFATPLAEIAREVLVWTQPALLPLVVSVPGVTRALALHDGVPDAEYDADIEVMELPHALRIELSGVHREVPYFRIPEPAARNRRTSELRVGIIWEAGAWDSRRSIAAALISPLSRIPGIRLFSLQRGPGRSQTALLPAVDFSSPSPVLTAARMKQLDLIISVDTMPAHLAGALGLPVWTLLHADCDWRWMDRRLDTPWYPTMRLFRQPHPEDWRWVIHKVAQELRAFCR